MSEKRMREALQKIAEQDAPNCDCDHSTDECCALVGEPCPKCIAERALMSLRSLSRKQKEPR